MNAGPPQRLRRKDTTMYIEGEEIKLDPQENGMDIAEDEWVGD